MFKSSNYTWGNSNTSKMIPCLLVVHVVIILSTLVQCASSESQVTSGKCDERKYIGGLPSIKCSHYTEIPSDIPSPGKVMYLDLSDRNHIPILETGSLERSNLSALMTLKFQNCQICIIERGAFAGGLRLMKIDLTGNMIDTLDPNVFSDVENLKELILQNNPIKRIASGHIFPNLPNLNTLDLSHCQLASIQANVFDNLNDLLELDLNGNHLKNLDWRMFRKIKSLQVLRLEDNPWHCDCQINFIISSLKELKNLILNKTTQFATCSSSDKSLADSTKKSWSGMLKDDMTCWPEINKFEYTTESSSVQRNDLTDNDNVNLEVKIGDDVHFECEYSGYPKPEIMWFKDNTPVKDISTVELAIKPKIELQDNTSTILQNMEEDEQRNNYNWKGHLIVRRVDAQDEGTYECFVQHKHAFVHKPVHLRVALGERDTSQEMDEPSSWTWVLVKIICGLIILDQIIRVVIAVSKRRQCREQRGITMGANNNVWWCHGLFLTSNAELTAHQSCLINEQRFHIWTVTKRTEREGSLFGMRMRGSKPINSHTILQEV